MKRIGLQSLQGVISLVMGMPVEIWSVPEVGTYVMRFQKPEREYRSPADQEVIDWVEECDRRNHDA